MYFQRTPSSFGLDSGSGASWNSGGYFVTRSGSMFASCRGDGTDYWEVIFREYLRCFLLLLGILLPLDISFPPRSLFCEFW
jgi:hypothetical protein